MTSRATMTMMFPYLTSAYRVRHLRIGLPLVPALVDNVRYFLPADLPPLEEQDLRAFNRPKLDRIGHAIPERACGPRWTSHDNARLLRRREKRELAELLGDPV